MPGYQPGDPDRVYSTGLEGREDDGLHLRRADGTAYVAQDDAFVLDFYAAHADDADADLVAAVLSNEQMWGQDLTQVPGLLDFVTSALAIVRTQGAAAAYAAAL